MLLNAIFTRRLTAAHTSRAHDKDCESAVHRLRALHTAAPVVQRIAPVIVRNDTGFGIIVWPSEGVRYVSVMLVAILVGPKL